MASLFLDVQTFWQSFWRFIQFLTMRTLHILVSRDLWIDFSDFKPFRCCQSCDRKTTYSCVMVAEFVPGVGTISVVLFFLIGCVVVEIYGCGSNSASDPTLARFGNGCCGTVGSRVVGSSQTDRFVLDEVDDVDWPGGGNTCSREGRRVVRRQESVGQVELLLWNHTMGPSISSFQETFWGQVRESRWTMCETIWGKGNSCSCMRICGTDGLEDSVSSRRRQRERWRAQDEKWVVRISVDNVYARGVSCFKSRSEYAIDQLSISCCNKDGELRDELRDCVQRSEEKDDPVKVIVSNEVGGCSEESNVMNSAAALNGLAKLENLQINTIRFRHINCGIQQPMVLGGGARCSKTDPTTNMCSNFPVGH